MADIKHYINGKDFGEPRNWQDLQITVDWLKKVDAGSINVSDLEFVLKANEYLQKRILDGVSGGVGIFEGDQYQIVVGDQENPEFVFDGYLDFTSEATVIGKEEIICALKKRKGDDWLNDVADGFSFAFLYDQGVIKKSDFIKVPYVINYVPDGMEIMMLSMAIYMMTKELIENVQNIADAIAEIINASTPVIGVGVGLGAVAVTAWDLGDFIWAGLKVLARIAYAIAMAVAIVNLITEIFEQLLPKKRDHLGMTFRKMMERACEHLGMTFQSSIVELDWVHIPTKNKKGGASGETGYPTNIEPIYTFGDMIRTLKEWFNADYRIKDNVFMLERKDKFKIPSPYKIPNYFNDQERILDQFKFNTDEMISNYNIYYQFDVQDQNTLDNQEGRVFQAITSPIQVKNKDFVTIKNIKEIAIPFTLGLYKSELTTVEEIAKVLGGVVDGLTGIFGGGTKFKSQINSRIGSLLTTSHFSTFGRVVKMSGSKLAKNQREILGVQNLWDNYHFINSFAVYQGEHNQFFRFIGQQVPMTIKEFAILTENNNATDQEGNEYLIEKVIYNPFKTTAVIDYRVKKLYTTNLQITFH